MATASLPRPRSPGRCRPGYLRGLLHCQAEGTSLALGLPVAGKWLSQLGCPAQDPLPPEAAWTRSPGSPSSWALLGDGPVPLPRLGAAYWTESRCPGRLRGADRNRSRSFFREAAQFWQAPLAARELGLYSWLDLNVEDNPITRSRGNTDCLAHRDSAPRQPRPCLYLRTGGKENPAYTCPFWPRQGVFL